MSNLAQPSLSQATIAAVNINRQENSITFSKFVKNVNILCIYGVAGHGKNEVDTVGGGAKIVLRTAITSGRLFYNAEECVEYLIDKFSAQEQPSYDNSSCDNSELTTINHTFNQLSGIST